MSGRSNLTSLSVLVSEYDGSMTTYLHQRGNVRQPALQGVLSEVEVDTLSVAVASVVVVLCVSVESHIDIVETMSGIISLKYLEILPTDNDSESYHTL